MYTEDNLYDYKALTYKNQLNNDCVKFKLKPKYWYLIQLLH